MKKLKKSVKNWNFHYEEVKENTIGNIAFRSVVTLIANYLLWEAFLACHQVWWHNYIHVGRVTFGIWTLFLWIGYEFVIPRFKKGERHARNLFPIVSIGGVLFLMRKNLIHTVVGITEFINLYLDHFNAYYQTDIYLIEPYFGTYKSYTFMLMLLWLACTHLMYSFKKRLLMVFFPLVGVVMCFCTGRKPEDMVVWMIFMAGLLLVSTTLRGMAAKLIYVAVVSVSLFLTSTDMSGKVIDRLYVAKEEVLEFQEDLYDTLFRSKGSWQIEYIELTKDVTNDEPEYTGTAVMEIRANHVPGTNLYLKGYYGTYYENGEWVFEEESFSAESKNASFSEETLSEYIAGMPMLAFSDMRKRSVKRGQENIASGDVDEVYISYSDEVETVYTVQYSDAIKDVGFAPYSMNYNGVEEEGVVIADSLVKKPEGVNRLEFYSDYSCGDDVLQELYAYEHPADTENRNLRAWYNEYVKKHYLATPEELEEIEKAAIEASGLFDAEMAAFVQYYANALEDEYISDKDREIREENIRRYAMTIGVYKYLEDNMSYSLILDDINPGTDPLEYALTKGHEGYCMHFSSIATLMLRHLDVPARYASGYVVRPDDFKWSVEDGAFLTTVRDFRAHAWVEIYYEGIGWVPIEMTPAYSNANIVPIEDDVERLERLSEINREKIQEEEADELETMEQTPETVLPQTPTQPEKEKDGRGIYKMLLIVAGTLFALTMLFAGVLAGRKRSQKVLEQDVLGGDADRAFKRIQKRILTMIYLKHFTKGLLFLGKVADKEYEDLLNETFPEVSGEDWARYMEIGAKRHFSNEGITMEELQHCYQCYLKIKR